MLVLGGCSSGPGFEVTLTSCGPGDAEGTVTNTGQELSNRVEITVAWYGDDGTVVFTGSGTSVRLPAGATGRWRVQNLSGMFLGDEFGTPNLTNCEVVQVQESELDF